MTFSLRSVEDDWITSLVPAVHVGGAQIQHNKHTQLPHPCVQKLLTNGRSPSVFDSKSVCFYKQTNKQTISMGCRILIKILSYYSSLRAIVLPYIANRSRWISFAAAKLNCNSLENICGWTVVLYGQSLLHRLFHWKSFVVTN